MIRLVYLAAAACLLCKLLTGRWPWDYLRPGLTRSQAVSRARKLLAVHPGASREEILEAHKQLLTKVHPDRGGSNDKVHEANAARDLLLDQLSDMN